MVVWTGCRIPNTVKLLQIEDGGHNWPRLEAPPKAWGGWSGGHNHDIQSAGAIRAFPRQFRKRDPRR